MKILWASRHELDPDALTALKGIFLSGGVEPEEIEVESKEILWPAEAEACRDIVIDLVAEYLDAIHVRAIFTGVFPAQAVEAFRFSNFPGGIGVYSPVSVPETEPDVKKTRSFRFVRWARIV